ncbi:MAG: PQQ-binding-like beta-propeller repeat protein [Candidatus Manganitrophus sp.]|nr:PQQ-binding-like beta-propeller repeat protein [Candidatus Manganitrophus sp.]
MVNGESLLEKSEEKRIGFVLDSKCASRGWRTLLFVNLALGMGFTLFLLLPASTYLGYAAKGVSPVKWIYTTGNTIYSRPAIGSDDSIYISSADTYLYAIDSQRKIALEEKNRPSESGPFY